MLNILLSIEGKESYTEQNFYMGLVECLCIKEHFKFASMSNYKECKQSKTNIEGLLKNIIIKNRKEGVEMKIFVISDLDDSDQFKSIYFTFKTIKDFVNKLEKVIIYKELIGDEGKSFDSLLPHKIKQKNIHKKWSNKRLFYLTADEKEWFNNDIINFEKLKNDFSKTKHIKIITEMEKYAKDNNIRNGN